MHKPETHFIVPLSLLFALKSFLFRALKVGVSAGSFFVYVCHRHQIALRCFFAILSVPSLLFFLVCIQLLDTELITKPGNHFNVLPDKFHANNEKIKYTTYTKKERTTTVLLQKGLHLTSSSRTRLYLFFVALGYYFFLFPPVSSTMLLSYQFHFCNDVDNEQRRRGDGESEGGGIHIEMNTLETIMRRCFCASWSSHYIEMLKHIITCSPSMHARDG